MIRRHSPASQTIISIAASMLGGHGIIRQGSTIMRDNKVDYNVIIIGITLMSFRKQATDVQFVSIKLKFKMET